MAKSNVSQSKRMCPTKKKADKVDELKAIYQRVMTCEPAVHPSERELLADMVFNKEYIVRPWRFAAMVATEGGTFFKDLSENAEKARLLAPLSKMLEEFAERLEMVAGLAKCSVMRMQVAGCNHADFQEWMAADPNADDTVEEQGACHV